jgi:competence ComEA-like helix-hairpin-helix protein
VTETTPEGALDRVDLNTADADALAELPGIGEVLAERIVDYRTENGPFQTVDEIVEVDGIGNGTLEEVRPHVTVDPVERTFEVEASVSFATDGVAETHVDDGDPGREGFVETYAYTLVTDADGLVLRGTWKDDASHPDFAWIPYSNPSNPSGSENPYLSMTSLTGALGTDLTRK